MDFGVITSLETDKVTFDGQDGKPRTMVIRSTGRDAVSVGDFVQMEFDGDAVTSIARSECNGRKCPAGYSCKNHRCVKN